MKHIAPFLFILLVSCSSFRAVTIPVPDRAIGQEPEKIHVNAEIWGIYLFKAVPVFSGSSFTTGGTTMFKNTISLEDVMKIIEREAAKLGAVRITGISSAYTSEWIYLSGVFWYREVQVSATIEKHR